MYVIVRSRDSFYAVKRVTAPSRAGSAASLPMTAERRHDRPRCLARIAGRSDQPRHGALLFHRCLPLKPDNGLSRHDLRPDGRCWTGSIWYATQCSARPPHQLSPRARELRAQAYRDR